MVNNEVIKVVGKYDGIERMKLKDGKVSDRAYKITFIVNNYKWVATAWMPWEKKDGTPKKGTAPPDLKLNEIYEISFTEKENPSNPEYPYKNIIGLYHQTALPAQNQTIAPQPVINTPKPQSTEKYSLETLYAQYQSMVPNALDQNESELIGVYMKVNYPDDERVQKVIKFWQQTHLPGE